MKLKVKPLFEDSRLVTKANPSDIGWVVYAHSIKEIKGNYIVDEATGDHLYSELDYIEYGTGLSIQPEQEINFSSPFGGITKYFSFLAPRSSLSKYKLSQANSIGVIDVGYNGELLIRHRYEFNPCDLVIRDGLIYGRINTKKIYKIGDAIGQILIMEQVPVDVEFVNTLDDTDRGDKGHGSSGNNSK